MMDKERTIDKGYGQFITEKQQKTIDRTYEAVNLLIREGFVASVNTYFVSSSDSQPCAIYIDVPPKASNDPVF